MIVWEYMVSSCVLMVIIKIYIIWFTPFLFHCEIYWKLNFMVLSFQPVLRDSCYLVCCIIYLKKRLDFSMRYYYRSLHSHLTEPLVEIWSQAKASIYLLLQRIFSHMELLMMQDSLPSILPASIRASERAVVSILIHKQQLVNIIIYVFYCSITTWM